MMPIVEFTGGRISNDAQGYAARPDATDTITLSGRVQPGETVTILDGTNVLGAAVLDNQGGWTFNKAVAGSAHLLRAVATDPGGNTAATLQLYTPLDFAGTTTISFADGIDIMSGSSILTYSSRTNHYDAGGMLLTQTFDNFGRSNTGTFPRTVTTAPDANGGTTSSVQTLRTFSNQPVSNLVKTYYDRDYHVLKQETYSPAGKLIELLTAADASGHQTDMLYAADGSTTLIDYEAGHKSYANHYDAAMAIVSQDRFDSASRIVSTTTAADAAGHLTATDYDQAGKVIAAIDYTAADTRVNAVHHTGDGTQSANYRIYTGDGILPIAFTTGGATAGDTFTLASAYTSPSHTTIIGFDPEDHVVLQGYDAAQPFTAQEDGMNVTLTLSDHSVVTFDHVAHVADLHLV